MNFLTAERSFNPEPTSATSERLSVSLSALLHAVFGAVFFHLYAGIIHHAPEPQEPQAVEVTITALPALTNAVPKTQEKPVKKSPPPQPARSAPVPVRQIVKPQAPKPPVARQKNAVKPVRAITKPIPAQTKKISEHSIQKQQNQIVNVKPAQAPQTKNQSSAPALKNPVNSSPTTAPALSASPPQQQPLPAKTPAPQPAISAQAQANALQNYVSTVKIKAESKKSYPPSARMRNIGGKTVLQIGITRSGSLAGAHIVQSSGSKALDNAAVQAVRAAAPYPNFPKELNRDRIDIRLPFSFTIE